MAVGHLDANGVWQYGESDTRDTFSALLNIGQDATSDAIGSDRARIAALEAAGATGPSTSNIATAGAGWTLTTARGRKKNGIAFVEFVFTRSGAAITVPVDGNIANETIGTLIVGWQQAGPINFALSTGTAGPVSAGVISNNTIILCAVAPGAPIAVGATLTLAGVYILA